MEKWLGSRFHLTEHTYTNDTIDFNNTRERIAYLRWTHSRNKPKMPRPRPRQRRSTATQQRKMPSLPTKRKLPTKQSLDSKLKEKQRQRNERRKKCRNQRIVLGGSRPQGRVRSTDPSSNSAQRYYKQKTYRGICCHRTIRSCHTHATPCSSNKTTKIKKHVEHDPLPSRELIGNPLGIKDRMMTITSQVLLGRYLN